MAQISILVVEDDELFADYLNEALAGLGYRVLGPVSTAKAAIAAAETQSPDLVLMDIDLGGDTDGIATAGEISSFSDVPVIYLTGHFEAPYLDKAKITTPYGYLAKPVAKQDLAATIEMALYRHSLDRKLKESEERLRLALSSARMGVWEWDARTNNVFWSPGSSTVAGSRDLATTFESFVALLHPEDASTVISAIGRVAIDEPFFDEEFRIVRPDDEVRWIASSAQGRFDHNGDLVGMVGTMRDITERRRTDENLLRLNRELRAISDCNQTLMRAENEQTLLEDICRIVCDEAGYRMAWVGYAQNDDARTVRPVAWYGVEDGYLSDITITWDDTECGRGPTGTAIRTGQPVSSEDLGSDPCLSQWAPGALGRGYRSSIALPLKDERGNAFGALNIYSSETRAFAPEEMRLLEELAGDLAFGITVLRARAEHQKSEEALRTSQLQLSQAADLARIAYWEHDEATGEFVFNDAFYELYGTTAEREGGYRMKGEEYRKRFVHQDDLEELARRIEVNVGVSPRKDALEFYEHRVIRPDGETMHVHVRNKLIMDSEGRPVKAVGVNQDVTVLKKMEEALREYEKVIESSPDMMVVIDRHYRYVMVNSAFLEYRNLKREEVMSRTVSDILGEEVFEETIRPNLERSFRGEFVRYELAYAYPGLGERHLLVSYLPIQGPQGIDRVACTLRDITKDKRTSQALRKSELQYQTMFETVRDGFASIDMDGRVVRANRTFQEMVGYTEEELLERTYEDFTPEKWHALEKGFLRTQVLTRGYSDVYRKEYIKRDGSIVPIEIRTHLLRDEEGLPFEMWAFVRDITDRVKAEDSLHRSEERYRSLFSRMTEGFALHEIVCDDKGRPCDYRFLEVNPAFERVTGLKRNSLIGRTVKEVIPGIESRWIEAYGRVALTGEPTRFENFSAGLGRYYEVFAYSPAPRQFAVLFADVTQRKNAEDKVRESETKFRSYIEWAPAAVFVANREGRIVDANPAATELLGYDAAALCNMHLLELHAAEDREEGRRKYSSFKRDGGIETEFRFQRKDGSFVWVLLRARTIGEELLLAYCTDITERKKLEEQLRQAQKMEAVGTLAGGVAHDFNNILTVIMGLGNVIQMNISPDDSARPLVDQIVLSSQRAADLTKSLLAFSRKQRMTPEPHVVDGVIANTASLLKRLLTEDIVLKVELKADQAVAMLDVGQLDQVLMNLATNARDAMPNGGSLTIGTDVVRLDEAFKKVHGFGTQGAYVHLSVSDSGIGMDEKTMARIFDPFFTTKAVGKGTGLGLASVYGIVKQHGGYITVKSELFRGTTFDIYLPLVDTPVQSTIGTPQVVKGGLETILVVEDDRDVRNLISRILTSQGYATIEAANGDDAIKAFDKHKKQIALVILDVVMPGRNGRQVFDEIIRIAPGTRAVFMSGYTGDIVIDKGVEKENVDFLQKPISVTTLLRKTREVLDR
jgi:PAS domain S-box-containing protein